MCNAVGPLALPKPVATADASRFVRRSDGGGGRGHVFDGNSGILVLSHPPSTRTVRFRSKLFLPKPDSYAMLSSMKTMTYTAARENLAATMQQVCDDHDPVIVTRRRDQAVVMMSMEDYASLEETAYLLRNPKNAKRLRDAIDKLRSGDGTERDLPELS